ncbi:sec-independent protein translocase protein TatA [Phycicoccus badiiscoriae]|uniref:Sec-independent protein translocase protein TatA n=1 Tax=Pedococcus badiiscoriae TaxID=642776 RepID=A0A852WQL7_9MICO|nr:Sec-independent protein translocase subunit TatA [Pedococcus badiiscoriae]NYG08505.1 sec-independent protein translocase protein TatA [Pedococcus badiiscoriae]
MGRGLFEGWHIIVLLVLLVLLFGFKRLPDAARSIGRSMRIFKSEVQEMKTDGKSAASSDTVKGEAIKDPERPVTPEPTSPIREDRPRTDNSSGAS